MDNFDLLNKRELAFILNNEEKFGDQLINQVEHYCQKKQFSLKKIKELDPKWAENHHQLNFETSQDQISVSRTRKTKLTTYENHIFITVAVGVVLLGVIFETMNASEFNWEFVVTLILSPLLLAVFVWLLFQNKKFKIKINQHKKINILKSSAVNVFVNGEPLLEDQIKAVNIFWEYDGEGSSTRTSLELKLIGNKAILIDEGKNNKLELLRCGNQIAQFTDKKLTIFNGNSPYKNPIEL